MKVEKITHVMIDRTFPAIVTESNELLVMIRMGIYWTERQFDENREYLSHLDQGILDEIKKCFKNTTTLLNYDPRN